MDKAHAYLVDNLVSPLWNEKCLEVVDQFFAPTADIRTSFAYGKGPEALKRSARETFEIFPNLSVKIEDIFQKDEKYIFKWTAQGCHSGSLMGIPPTGQNVHFAGIVFGKMEDNLVTAYHSFSNVPLILHNLYQRKRKSIERFNAAMRKKSEQLQFDVFEELGKLLRFPLTQREFECLKHWMKGCSIKETARRMDWLSERTIQTYRESIKKKFGVYNYHQILGIIQARGLLEYLF